MHFFCNDMTHVTRVGPVIEFVYLYLCIFQHCHFGSKGRNEALHVMSPACEVTTTCKLGQRNTNRGLTPQQQEEKYLKSLFKIFKILPTMSCPLKNMDLCMKTCFFNISSICDLMFPQYFQQYPAAFKIKIYVKLPVSSISPPRNHLRLRQPFVFHR